jgi:aminoacrylate hydrolase
MLMAHDTAGRLNEIKQPTLVLCADLNLCTPLPLSEELAQHICNAALVVLRDAGELVEIEKPEVFFQTVSGFIQRNR